MPVKSADQPRRLPQQARSRRMVEKLLDAAGVEFVEAGYEGATTNRIAERAGVSVGSLYQFFPNKTALLTTLHARWTERLERALDGALRDAANRNIGEVIDEVLDVHARLNLDPPGLLGLLLTTPPPGHGVASVRAAVLRRLEEIFEVRAPQLTRAQRVIAARMAIHITGGLYTLGTRAGATDPAVRAEVRAALLAYVTPILRPVGQNA